MHWQPHRMCPIADLPHRRHRHHRPARRHVRVFDRNQPRRRMKLHIAINRPPRLLPRQRPPLRQHRPQRAAGEHCRHPHLPVQHMRPRFAHHLLPGLRVQPDRDLIAHRPGRHKQRRLAPKHLRRPRLQPVHRRIFAVHIVAHLGLSHRCPHLRRRPRHRVTSQVNQVLLLHPIKSSSSSNQVVILTRSVRISFTPPPPPTAC